MQRRKEPKHFEREQGKKQLWIRDQALAAATGGIVITDPNQPDNPIIYVNPGFEHLTEYAPEEVLGHNCRFLQGSDTDQPALDELRTAIAEGRDFRGVLRNYRKDGSLFWNELSISPVHDEKGHLVNFVGVQNDVTGRVQAEEELRRAGRELNTIFESITDAFFTLDNEWRFTHLNSEAERVLQRTREELLGKNVWAEFPEAVGATFDREYHRAVEEQTSVEFEEFYPPLEVWFEVKAYPSDVGLSVYFRDVTERKKAQEALRESEERLRTILVQYASDVILIVEADGTIRYESPAVEGVLGYRPEERIGEHIFDYMHPDDIAWLSRTYKGILDNRGVSSPVEVRVRHKDGSWRYLEGIGNNLLDEPGVRGIVINFRDITDRKRAEEVLRESEERYRRLAESAPEGIAIHSEGRIVYINAAGADLLGVRDPEDVLGKPIMDLVHPNYREMVRERVRRIHLEGGVDEFVEEKLVRLDGRVIDIEVGAVPTVYEGNEAMQVVVRDITQRKQAEDTLKKSEQRFRQFFEQSVDALFIHDESGKILDCNSEACRSLGYTREELLDLYVQDLTGDLLSEEELREREKAGGTLWQRAMTGDPTAFGNIHLGRHKRKDGTTFPMEVRVGGVGYGGRRMIVASVRDITERKEIERRLEESEQRYKSLFAHNPDAVYSFDLEGNFLTANAACAELSGYTVEELLQMSFMALIVPEDLPRVLRHFEKAARGEPRTYETAIIHRDGDRVELNVTKLPIIVSGEVVGVYGIAKDITERKRAEEELRRSEHELAEAQRITQVGSWSFDVAEDEARWSDEMYRIFGFVPQEFIVTYKKFLKLVHPDDKKLLLRAVREALYRRKDRYDLDYRLVRPDGEVRFLYSHYEVVRDGLGRAVRLIGTSQDITEHKRAEGFRSRLAAIVESSDDAIISRTLDGTITSWNPGAERLYGYTAEEIIGRSNTFLYPPEHPHEMREIQEKIRRGESIDHYETVRMAKDGRRIHVSLTVSPTRDAAGNVTGDSGIARDITERKQAEEALRRWNEYLRALQQTTLALMKRLNPDDLLETLVMRAGALIGTSHGYIYLIEPGETELEMRVGSGEFDKYAGQRLKPGECVPGCVWKNGQPLVVDDYRTWEGRCPPFDQGDFGAVVGVPLKSGSDVVGVIGLAYLAEDRTFGRDEVELLSRFAELASIALDNARLHASAQQEIAERKRAQDTLKRSEVRNKAILEANPDLIFVYSRSGEYLDLQSNSPDKLYLPREELLGSNLREVLPPEVSDPFLHKIARTLDTGEMQIYEYGLDVPEGTLDFEARMVVSGRDEVLCAVRDITERKALEERLKHQAFHDALTGLPNRALLIDRLQHALSRTDRHGGHVAVLFLDLDNFKNVNDSLGHEAGDQLLSTVARRLEACVRPEDTVARLGGDEFVILLQNAKRVDDATLVAERIIEELKAPLILGGHEVLTATSIGIALSTSSQDLPDNLLSNADAALYQAKKWGKGNYEVFNPSMHLHALERLKLENELKRAIEREEFVLYYQPKVLLETGRVVGVEALVRWKHPERGLIPPDEFIPLAEETGLIVPIGQLVLDEACRQTRAWQEQHPGASSLKVCVNLSARQFQHPRLTQEIIRTLRKTQMDLSKLTLEITESIAMEAGEPTSARLSELKELGVELAIDDFGTGYSSLAYLKRLPVDELKIDKFFIGGLGEDREDTVLVSAIIELAHALSLRVVAEGVETVEQLEELRKLGCDMAQGNHLMKPLTREETSALMETISA